MDEISAREIGLVYLMESVERNRLARRFADNFEKYHNIFATAESCTGGMIGSALTEISGSSHWFECGFITYSNKAKMSILGVQHSTLQEHGAVSLEVAREMAAGALTHSDATMAVSVTGIAGPTGGSDEKPVGTVCIGLAERGAPAVAQVFHFRGDRCQIRYTTMMTALQHLLALSEGHCPEGYTAADDKTTVVD